MQLMRLLAILIVLAPCLPAQEPAPDDVRERAEEKLDRGRRRAALDLLRPLAEAEPAAPEDLRLATTLALQTGDAASAGRWSARLLQQGEGAARGDLLLRARVLEETGDVAGALAVLNPLLERREPPAEDGMALDFPATAMAARLHASRGQDTQAEKAWDSLVQESKRVVVRRSSDLLALARAYVWFRNPRLAERTIVRDVLRSDGENTDALLQLAKLYASYDYQLPADAVRRFRQVQKIEKGLADVHAGIGSAYEIWLKDDEAVRSYRRALRLNPNHKQSLAALARIHLVQRKRALARQEVGRALKVDPGDREALAVSAAIDLIEKGDEAFAKALERVLAVDPTFTRAHRVAARTLDRYWRWPEALALMRKAVAITPDDPAVHDERARFAFYLGLEKEGTESLRKADACARFGIVWRKNMWKVHKRLRDKFVVIETEHFIHRVKKSEKAALEPYLKLFAEQSYELLSRKYRFRPPGLETHPGKILVEHFDNHQDFSVRTWGQTGLGIQGVCFGPFIAQDSPGAGIPHFSWYRTLHHELTHTMTLGLSKGRIPRWFTEGLSTLEEVLYEPAWDRRLDRMLFDALKTGDLLSVTAFDAAFQSPRVMFAYFQAGVVCQMIAEEFGFEKILGMIAAYGEGRDTTHVMQDVLKLAPAAFDARFAEYVGRRVSAIRVIPGLSSERMKVYAQRVESGKGSLEDQVLVASALLDRKQIADANEVIFKARKLAPDDARLDWLEGRLALMAKRRSTARRFFEAAAGKGYENHDMQLSLAAMHEAAGEEEAMRAAFRSALATWPTRGDRQDPRLDLARLAESSGNQEEATRLREEHLKLNFADLRIRRGLLDRYLGKKAWAEAERHLRAMIFLIPQNQQIHNELGKVLLETGRAQQGVAELEVAVGVSTDDMARADALVRLARARWKKLADPKGARETLERALDVAPDHEPARKLLKELKGAIR